MIKLKDLITERRAQEAKSFNDAIKSYRQGRILKVDDKKLIKKIGKNTNPL